MARRRDQSPAAAQRALDAAATQLATLRSAASESERRDFLGLLAAAIAHEVTNILTPVRGYAELALANPKDADAVHAALQAAALGSERACLVAEAILACARGEPSEPAALAPAIERAAALVAPFHVEHVVSPKIRAGMGQVALEQVVLNLLLNARAAGSKKAVVTAEVVDGVLRIGVEDGGCGISAERVGRIFEPFVTQRGRGLGLTICRYLVESAGGRISVSSNVGVGT
jgi:signal transduction histidine kinase